MRPVSGLLSICTVEYGGHRYDKHEGKAMSLKSRVDKLERAINKKRGMTLNDLLSMPWPQEQVEKFKRCLPHQGNIDIKEMLELLPEDFRNEVLRLIREKY